MSDREPGRQIPMSDYLPPHLIRVHFKTMREFVEEYPPRTPDEVLSSWKAIAKADQ